MSSFSYGLMRIHWIQFRVNQVPYLLLTIVIKRRYIIQWARIVSMNIHIVRPAILIGWLVGWLMVFQRHFQQYFSYIVAVGSLVDETGENHRTAASHIITLCYIEYIFLIMFVVTVLYVYMLCTCYYFVQVITCTTYLYKL